MAFELPKEVTTSPFDQLEKPPYSAVTMLDAPAAPMPKDKPLEFPSVTADRLKDVVPAEILMSAEPVMTEPFSPNETLLLLEKVRFVRLFDVVPAEMLIGPDAVMTETLFNPNVRLLAFANVTAVRLKLVVPAETLIDCAD